MSSTKNQQRIIFIYAPNKDLPFLVLKNILEESSNNDIIVLGSRHLKRSEEALEKLVFLSNLHLI